MGKNPVFPVYAADFEMDTASWENDVLGAYLRLLFSEWINGFLPADHRHLAKISRETYIKFEKKWKIFGQKFVADREGNLINIKLESVRDEKRKFLDSQREKGIKSGKARLNRGSTGAEPGFEPTTNLSSSSSFSSSKKKTKTKSIYGEKFHRVNLTEEERKSLDDAFGPSKAVLMIENMDLYLESKGDKYKSHYATLLSWERKNGGTDGRFTGGQRQVETKTSRARNLGDGAAYPCDLEVTE